MKIGTLKLLRTLWYHYCCAALAGGGAVYVTICNRCFKAFAWSQQNKPQLTLPDTLKFVPFLATLVIRPLSPYPSFAIETKKYHSRAPTHWNKCFFYCYHCTVSKN